jgi:DNA-binding transcriptional ArsR family regulator
MSDNALDLTFSALADSTRRAILSRLAGGQASVTELMQPFAISQPSISNHLKVLERAGLISRSRSAQFRPCQLQPGPLKSAAAWIDEYRRFWEGSFDQLETYLHGITSRIPKR